MNFMQFQLVLMSKLFVPALFRYETKTHRNENAKIITWIFLILPFEIILLSIEVIFIPYWLYNELDIPNFKQKLHQYIFHHEKQTCLEGIFPFIVWFVCLTVFQKQIFIRLLYFMIT